MIEEPLLIRIPTAARRLSISVRRAYSMARRNELPGVVRLGGRTVRVSAKALEEWVDSHQEPLQRPEVTNRDGKGAGSR